MGYQRNEHDWCITNKIVNGTKCTILWNVDDLNKSYVDSNIISGVIADIDTEYGKNVKTTI